MILVDSSVWIDFFRGSGTGRILRRLIEGEESLCLTGINLTEILQGIKEDQTHEQIQRHLLTFPIFLTKGVETYLHGSDIFRKCRRQGKTIRKTMDCIISAIAIENNLTLLHNDRDFDHIAKCTQLKIYSEAAG
ncbi:MAG: PIN domain nuclease [Nitrospira sp.]|nr:PIN domain nuclease [Candidatus Manganitrophaceae bacterium]HIL33820.1 PIN domain nuclease [Candidatus Manganitrophaceae bacterium]